MHYEQLNAGIGVAMQQFSRQEPVHAYLLTGARGIGKRTLATILTSALFCVSENKPCGRCAACRRVWDDNEPDVLTLFPDDKGKIGIEPVRELIQKVSQHAFGTGFRVVLIEPVESMTLAAQNCLLKSLEEPIANVVFLLMTHELTATLGTIASRCIRVKLTPWPDDVLRSALSKLGYSSSAIENVLSRCGGNIGTALDMLDEAKLDGEAQQFAMEALSILSDAAAVSVSTRLKEDKGNADAYLSAIETAIHQALMVRTGQLGAVFLSSYPAHWQKAAAQVKCAATAALGRIGRPVVHRLEVHDDLAAGIVALQKAQGCAAHAAAAGFLHDGEEAHIRQAFPAAHDHKAAEALLLVYAQHIHVPVLRPGQHVAHGHVLVLREGPAVQAVGQGCVRGMGRQGLQADHASASPTLSTAMRPSTTCRRTVSPRAMWPSSSSSERVSSTVR